MKIVKNINYRKILLSTFIAFGSIFFLGTSQVSSLSLNAQSKGQTSFADSTFGINKDKSAGATASKNKYATTSTKNSTISTKKSSPEKKKEPWAWWEIAFVLYWGLGCLAIVIHTPLVLYRSDAIKSYANGVDFSQKRKNAGLNPESTAEENEKCVALLNKAFEEWGYAGDVLIPKHGNAYKRAYKALNEVAKIMPTDEKLCSEISYMSAVFANAGDRTFSGSWWAVICACVFVYMSGFSLFMIGSLILYIVASLTPNYLQYLRHKHGLRRTGTSEMIAVAAEDFNRGTFIRTTTTYSDGSKKVEDDHSPQMDSIIWVVIISVVVGLFISFFAVFNYLRNYVFYF